MPLPLPLPIPPVVVLGMELAVPVMPGSVVDPEPEPEPFPSASQSSASVPMTLRRVAGTHTGALGQGHRDDLRGIVTRAGLGGAVANTVLVVHVVAQAGHVIGSAAKRSGLGIHVGDTHLLSGVSVSSCTQERREAKILTAHWELDKAAAETVPAAASRAIAMGEKDFIVLVEGCCVRCRK